MSAQQSMLSLRCINEREMLGEQRVRNIKRLSAAGPCGLLTQHLPLEAADVRQGQVLLTDKWVLSKNSNLQISQIL